MWVKIYVNKECDVCEDYPRILTKKQFEERVNAMVADSMKAESLAEDDDFDDFLGATYSNKDIFFMTQEDKNQELEIYKERVRIDTYDYLLDIYEEYDIEV